MSEGIISETTISERPTLKTRTDNSHPSKPTKFRNREDAETQVCDAIVSLGKLAGIKVDVGEGPDDIDPALTEAAYQSNFNDPHFLGGPCCFNYARTADDVDGLVRNAEPVLSGFSEYISARRSQEEVQKAAEYIAIVEAAFAWLRKTNRSQ